MYCTDVAESEALVYGLCRSRSSQDISIPDFEMATIAEAKWQAYFSRQGAIRRRTIEHSREQGLSIIALLTEDPPIPTEHLFCEVINNRKLSLMPEIGCHKQTKNSMLLSVVKDVWKSLKNDVIENENVTKGRKPNPKQNGGLEKKTSSPEDITQTVLAVINDVSTTIKNNSHPITWMTETTWTEIVENSESLTKSDCDLQAAIWELIETESSCLNVLWIITKIFLPVFCKLQTRFEEIAKIEISHLFGNIEEVYDSHIILWETCISVPLIKSRDHKTALDILLMREEILSISSIMESYKTFMKLQPFMNKRFQELEKNNFVFKEYIQWTRSYSKSCRDGIFSLVSVPLQRLMKYKLLLDRIKCFIHEEQRDPLNQMISAVHHFVEYIDSIVAGEDRLEDIKSKLVTKFQCESVHISKLLQEKGAYFDISKSSLGSPERVLIHHGQLKMRFKNNKRTEVQCYLFNDLFLVCTPIRKDWNKLEIYKSPIRIDKFLIKEEPEGSFMAFILNDFSTIDSIMTFTGETDQVKLWIDKCNRTRFLFQSKFESANKLPNRYFSQRSLSKEIAEQKIDPICDQTFHHESVKKKFSQASVSGYSTCSTDSFSSTIIQEGWNSIEANSEFKSLEKLQQPKESSENRDTPYHRTTVFSFDDSSHDLDRTQDMLIC